MLASAPALIGTVSSERGTALTPTPIDTENRPRPPSGSTQPTGGVAPASTVCIQADRSHDASRGRASDGQARGVR
jgi:hypothetical protein